MNNSISKAKKAQKLNNEETLSVNKDSPSNQNHSFPTEIFPKSIQNLIINAEEKAKNKYSINPYFLPKYNRFDKGATKDTFYDIFYPEDKRIEIAKSAALTLLGIGALQGVAYLKARRDNVGKSEKNFKRLHAKYLKEDLNYKKNKAKRSRINKLFKIFKKVKCSSNFLNYLNYKEFHLYNKFILKNY